MSDAKSRYPLEWRRSHVDVIESGGGKYAPGTSTIGSSQRLDRAGDSLARSSNIGPPMVAKPTFDDHNRNQSVPYYALKNSLHQEINIFQHFVAT